MYLFIIYLAYYCIGVPYPGIYYVLFVTFIIYIIIIIIIGTIIITIIIIIVIIIVIITVIYTFMLFYIFLHRATSSFCSPTTATLIVSWLLLFRLICNYMGIVSFFKYCINYIKIN